MCLCLLRGGNTHSVHGTNSHANNAQGSEIYAAYRRYQRRSLSIVGAFCACSGGKTRTRRVAPLRLHLVATSRVNAPPPPEGMSLSTSFLALQSTSPWQREVSAKTRCTLWGSMQRRVSAKRPGYAHDEFRIRLLFYPSAVAPLV